MAENKMTLDEAIKLANEGDYSKLDNVQLSQMNRVLNEAASKEGADQDLKDTAEAMVLETENRLTELNGKTDFAMGDLESIIDLASSISGFSKNADLARAVLEKATKQKENPTSKQMNEAALDDILASDQYTDEEKDLALDAAIEYNNEIDAKAAASEFEVGDASAASENGGKEDNKKADEKQEENSQLMDKTKSYSLDNNNYKIELNSGQPPYILDTSDEKFQEMINNLEVGQSFVVGREDSTGQIKADFTIPNDKDHQYISRQHLVVKKTENGVFIQDVSKNGSRITEITPKTDENTAENDGEEQLEEAENIPEDQAALEAFDKEYGIDTMTAEQLEKNAEVMDASEFNPFELNEEGKLVHPEFQAEYDAIQNLEITDDNGEPLSEEEQKKAKEDLLQTAIFEADMLTRGTARGDEEAIKSQYKANLKSSLQKAVVSAAFASEIEGKPQNRETYGAAFAKAAAQEGGLKTSLKNIMAYAGVVNGEMTKLRDRLQNKFKEIPAVQKMSAKIAAFDKSMGEKHPKMWKTAKRVGGILAKRVKGIAVYTAVGATAGPIGLAALAVKSGYDSYKGLNEKAKKAGMTLGQYAKTHKMEVGLAFTTSALSLAGSALGLGAGGSEMAQTVSPYLKTATRALAIGPKAAKAAFHGLKAAAIKMGWKKGNVQEELAAAKAALNQTVDATIGMVAGSYLNEGVQSAHAAMDKDGDGTLDIFDADHGEGWATANEQQLDGLMNDAESVNAILGEGHNHTPEELREMLSKGEFTDEQLKDIHEFATKNFDENGIAIDKDGDGIVDYKDRDHGNGWAHANDKQLDALLKDPEAVNSALDKAFGPGHNYTSEELRDMVAQGKFNDVQMRHIDELASKAFDENGTAVDKDGDGIADYKDVDHGEGWATANEKQLDRLMETNAKEVNELLNDGKWHSSDDLKDMMAKGENVEGGFTTEQLKAIHALASKDYDENGYIINKDLHKFYEDLAKQAETKTETQETPDENKGAEQTEPTEVEKTQAEEQMYEAILATISKGEDMNNPEVKASVEALAQQHFNDVKGALAAGNEQAAVDLLHGLHKQGEAAEVHEATQREDDDSRGVRHAKEDLAKVSSQLDEAKAALAADPNNEQLQREVEKLEKEFDKKSLNLDNKEIKQERSELKDQINRDNRSADNLDRTREQLEKNLGISQEAADKQLAAAGFDLNNLPKDTENLPEDVQKLINAHNQYAQVDQTEATLRGRVAENEQAREDLKAQEKENKEAMKDVKKGRGFSTDDEKRASIEDRLPGQSDFRDSEMASSLVNMARGGNEGATQEPEKVESNEEKVDRFLRDQVAKGNMTEAEAQEQREALVAKANAQKANEEYAQQMANPDNWQEYQAQIDPSPLQGKPETAPVYQPENEGETLTAKIDPSPLQGKPKEAPVYEDPTATMTREERVDSAAQSLADKVRNGEISREDALKVAADVAHKQNDEVMGKRLAEGIEKSLDHEPNVVDSELGKVSYTIGDDGVLKINQDLNVYRGDAADRVQHNEVANDIGDHIYGHVEARHDILNSEKDGNVIIGARAGDGHFAATDQKAYEAEALKIVHDDIQNRISNGETVPGADKALGEIENRLSTLGLQLGKNGELEAVNNQSDLPSYRKMMESEADRTEKEEPQTKPEPKAEEKTENREAPEAVAEPYVAETKAGNISYSMDDNGQYKTGGTISVINDYEKYKDIEKEISAGMGNTPGKSMIVGHKAQIAYMADAINKDIEARLARGEDVPHAKEMMEMNNKQLKAMGLEYDKDGHLHSSKANAGNVQTRGKGGRE